MMPRVYKGIGETDRQPNVLLDGLKQANRLVYMYVLLCICRLRTLLKEWTSQIHNIIGYIGTVSSPTSPTYSGTHKESSGTGGGEKSESDGGEKERDENEGVEKADSPLDQLIVDIEKWRSALSHAIDSQDTQITEQVVIHSVWI